MEVGNEEISDGANKGAELLELLVCERTQVILCVRRMETYLAMHDWDSGVKEDRKEKYN